MSKTLKVIIVSVAIFAVFAVIYFLVAGKFPTVFAGVFIGGLAGPLLVRRFLSQKDDEESAR